MLDCISWSTLPLKEAILATQWPELGLAVDPDFLVRHIKQGEDEEEEQELHHNSVIPDLLRSNYSLNRCLAV